MKKVVVTALLFSLIAFPLGLLVGKYGEGRDDSILRENQKIQYLATLISAQATRPLPERGWVSVVDNEWFRHHLSSRRDIKLAEYNNIEFSTMESGSIYFRSKDAKLPKSWMYLAYKNGSSAEFVGLFRVQRPP